MSGHDRTRPDRSAPVAGRPVRVVVVDDHAIVRRGLSTLLEIEEDIEVVVEASNGRLAIEAVRRYTPDVVLMDICMPEVNGIEATRAIHTEYPDIAVIALSMHDEKHQGAEMRDAGAVAYVSKSGAPSELAGVIREVA